MLSRRMLLGVGGVIGVSAMLAATRIRAQLDQQAPDQDDKLISQGQYGDPSLPHEVLRYNPVRIQEAVGGQKKAAFEPRIGDILGELVKASGLHVGESRVDNRSIITNYLALFNLPFEDQGLPVPFCAAGLSFIAVQLYAKGHGGDLGSLGLLRNFLGEIDHYHFYPSPSVVDMKLVAMGKRRWVTAAQAVGPLFPRPGWLVVFDWNGDGTPDHVGLIESVSGSSLSTIEFNTSSGTATAGSQTDGGHVARKKRAINGKINGFIRPELSRSA